MLELRVGIMSTSVLSKMRARRVVVIDEDSIGVSGNLVQIGDFPFAPLIKRYEDITRYPGWTGRPLVPIAWWGASQGFASSARSALSKRRRFWYIR